MEQFEIVFLMKKQLLLCDDGDCWFIELQYRWL